MPTNTTRSWGLTPSRARAAAMRRASACRSLQVRCWPPPLTTIVSGAPVAPRSRRSRRLLVTRPGLGGALALGGALVEADLLHQAEQVVAGVEVAGPAVAEVEHLQPGEVEGPARTGDAGRVQHAAEVPGPPPAERHPGQVVPEHRRRDDFPAQVGIGADDVAQVAGRGRMALHVPAGVPGGRAVQHEILGDQARDQLGLPVVPRLDPPVVPPGGEVQVHHRRVGHRHQHRRSPP